MSSKSSSKHQPCSATHTSLSRQATMLFAASIIFSAFVLQSSGASVHLSSSSIASTGFELCPSAIMVNSTTMTIAGHDIQRTTFECPDDSLSVGSSLSLLGARSPVIVPDALSELSKRNAAECRTATPECQCGQPTTCACVSTTPDGPTGNDCSTLIDSLKVIPQVVGSTFVVQSRTFQLLQFQTCAIEFSNLGLSRTTNGAIEYCWDEVVALTGLTNEDCVEPGVSTGATCTPSDALWNIQLLRISS